VVPLVLNRVKVPGELRLGVSLVKAAKFVRACPPKKKKASVSVTHGHRVQEPGFLQLSSSRTIAA